VNVEFNMKKIFNKICAVFFATIVLMLIFTVPARADLEIFGISSKNTPKQIIQRLERKGFHCQTNPRAFQNGLVTSCGPLGPKGRERYGNSIIVDFDRRVKIYGNRVFFHCEMFNGCSSSITLKKIAQSIQVRYGLEEPNHYQDVSLYGRRVKEAYCWFEKESENILCAVDGESVFGAFTWLDDFYIVMEVTHDKINKDFN